MHFPSFPTTRRLRLGTQTSGPVSASADALPSAADGQIASIARVNELVVVTANVKDFRRFEGLEVQNWFR